MAEQPYTYADIVVGKKKFFTPEGEKLVGEQTDEDLEVAERKKENKVKPDNNNIKKDTSGAKSESATVGDADPNAPKFVANGYSTDLGEISEEEEMAAERSAISQDTMDTFRNFHFGSARKPNSLDAYASKNYLWTLAALSNDECNFPHKTYRLKGPKAQQTVIKMGGFPGSVSAAGPMPARPMTELEKKQKIPNTEYYIDNVSIKSVVAPNKKTRVTTAFAIEFEVTEPYSMGQFLQHLQLCAMNAGYSNYLECPYLLQLDVVGYKDVKGDLHKLFPAREPKRQMCVKIFSVEFDVNGGGSRYTVKATPFNENALTDQNQSIPDNVSISGRTIQEILQTGVNSLATAVNSSKLTTATKGKQPHEPDEIIILFPTDMAQNIMKDTLADVDNTALFGDFTKDKREYDQEEVLGSAVGVDFIDPRPQFGGSIESQVKTFVDNKLGYSIKRNNLSEKIKNEFTASNFTNKIGSTQMFTDGSLDPGSSNFGYPNFVYDPKAKVVHRNGTTINPTSKNIQFKQGTKIQRIIEELVLISDWGKGLLKKGQLVTDSNTGFVDWFRIEVQTYVLDAPVNKGKFNKFPKIFVYNVVPAKVHCSVFMMPNDPPVGYGFLKQQAVKHYNYIYTGKNTDVLSFDINFRTAFFTAIAKDFMNSSTSNDLSSSGRDNQDPATDMKAASGSRNNNILKTADIVASLNETQQDEQTNGAVAETPSVRVARAFQDSLINSPADLISADLTILGDLYFMSDSGLGNYFSAPTPFININADGTMNHQNGEVDIIINFKTPVDIGEGSPTAKGLEDVAQFSGLYKVITVTNSFRGNTYTNELTLVRRLNQYAKESYDNAEKIKEQIFNQRDARQARIDTAIASGNADELARALADFNEDGKLNAGVETQAYEKYLQNTKADVAQFEMRKADYAIKKKLDDVDQAGRIRGGL